MGQGDDAAAAGPKTARVAPCHTCRRQRLRCDGSRPGCGKCAARGVECLGYGARPILWVQPQSAGPWSRPGPDAGPGRAPARKRGRPKLVLMSKEMPKEDMSKEEEQQSGPSDARRLQLQPRPSQQRYRWIQAHGTAADRERGPDRRGMPSMYANLDPVDYQKHRLALDSLIYCTSRHPLALLHDH